MFDFDEVKKGQIPDKSRELLRTAIHSALLDIFGEDNVTQTGNNEFAVCLGLRTLESGEKAEIVNVIDWTFKPYENKITSSGKKVDYFDRVKQGERYEEEQEIAKAKEEQKAKDKAEREEKQRKLKEQPKAEREEKARQNNEDNG